ncbi:hypothetical protein [Thalassotalea sp. PLHSN55]|uniref:hypothetical protein n=1 Tax=Thalassotalea sp. PLHSN55 TaxID=3435888 RepID=UPI003F86A2D8
MCNKFYHTKLKLVLLASLLLLSVFKQVIAQTTGWNFNNYRIAISADGNNQADDKHKWPKADPDDWGGTPVALAMIAKLKAQNNVVHFSYNNFIDAPPHTTAVNEMADGVNGAISRWHYNPKLFFDVSNNANKALEHLVQQIVISTKDNPLYFVHMGPAEFFYRAIERVLKLDKADSLNYVFVLSHSGYNDNHLRRGDAKFDKFPVAAAQKHHTIKEAITLSGDRLNYKLIQDQNAKWDANKLWNSEHDWSVWQWMVKHPDPSVRWLHERLKRHTKGIADCSDAGLVFYLLTGDDNGSPSKLQSFIGSGIIN